jgi:hypothetical protein
VFTNRHVVVALLVAPVLAVLAWFGVDQLIGERAAPAQPGQSYPLVAQSNCRYASGQCELKNAEFSLRLELDASPPSHLLLSASHPLEGVQLGLTPPDGDAAGDPGLEAQPQSLRPRGDDGLNWVLPLQALPPVDAQLRLVASAGGALYYAETVTAFVAGTVPARLGKP